MDHDLPVAPQPTLNLPGAPSLFQSQGEYVVMTTEADQDPLSDIHPVTGELERVRTIPQVGLYRDVTLSDLTNETYLSNLSL